MFNISRVPREIPIVCLACLWFWDLRPQNCGHLKHPMSKTFAVEEWQEVIGDGVVCESSVPQSLTC